MRHVESRHAEGAGTPPRDLHVAVARAIEATRDPTTAAAELSHHLGFSDDPADLRAAAEYSVLAGDRALSSFQPAMAARHYREALALADRLEGPLPLVDRCDLEAKLGFALKSSGDSAAAEHFLSAFRSARELGDPGADGTDGAGDGDRHVERHRRGRHHQGGGPRGGVERHPG